MKFAKTCFVINLIIILLGAIVLIPSGILNFGGKEINIPDLDFSVLCLSKEVDEETGEEIKTKCLFRKDPHFSNTRDFANTIRYRYEFTDLSSDEAENIDETIAETVEIITQRINITGIRDYSIREVKAEEGLIYLEIDFVENDENYFGALDLITSEGDTIIYQDIAGYTPEGGDDAGFNFLEGKTPSLYIQLKDVKKINHYYDPLVLGGNGGFVVDLKFGKDMTENVGKAAEPSYTAQTLIPGIQLVQEGFPIGVQAAAVNIPQTDQGGNQVGGQSNVLFTDFSDPNSKLRTGAIAGVAATNPINTTLTFIDQEKVSPDVSIQTLSYIKAAILIAIILIVVFLIALFKYNGFIVSTLVVSHYIVSMAFIKLTGTFGVGASSILVVGSFIGIGYGIVLMSRLLRDKLDINELKNYQESLRGYVWILAILMLIVSFVISKMFGLNSSLKESVFVFTIFAIMFIYIFEIALRGFGSVLVNFKIKRANK